MCKFNKKVKLSIVALTIISCISISGCKKNNEVVTTPPKDNVGEIKVEDKKPEIKVENKESKEYKFEKVIENKDRKIVFNTPWKTNGANNKSACIEGKGEQAVEEGVGEIFVKDLKTEQLTKFQLINNKKQMSPKFIEWCDENNLFVVIGMGHGTVSMGGNLYLLNINDNVLSVVYETKDAKKQISSVKKMGNNIELIVTVYEDDNLDKKHEEKWIINSFDEKLKSTMQIKDDKGKLIDTIN